MASSPATSTPTSIHPTDPAPLADTAELARHRASADIDAKTRASRGQYMTPAPIARFMASLFSPPLGELRILDPGAGVGSLTAALADRLAAEPVKPTAIDFFCYEIDTGLTAELAPILDRVCAACRHAGIAASTRVLDTDFILGADPAAPPDLFGRDIDTPAGFSHAILNPPYRKINSSSRHRAALRRAGLETSNLYTGFLFLAAQQLSPAGELVAIVPRSFCNGPYFKPFRLAFFSTMTLRHIHVFERRNRAFGENDVLQENVILHAVKGADPGDVRITTSSGADFSAEPDCTGYTTPDLTSRSAPLHTLISPDDPDRFLHIATTRLDRAIAERIVHFTGTLADLGIAVSTGPVVQFRLRDDLRQHPGEGTAPLLHPAHFRDGRFTWPRDMRKPNAIYLSDRTRKWLWPNSGHYVVTRRFTSKEEPRRIVASIYPSDLPGELVGFENHLNVFHADRRGMPPDLARGLALFLNSSLVDLHFRQFNGHTQVNATDLRALPYPGLATLQRIGAKQAEHSVSQTEIDAIIEQELSHMTADQDPLDAQRKIDNALDILQALGLPSGQRNKRSALTLLALIDLKPSGSWSDLRQPLIGITPIMDNARDHYGQEYAPNTRETFRRQTMHQFVNAGIALLNPDQPSRAVNSPKTSYRISPHVLQLLQTYGTDTWQPTLDDWLANRETLAAKWAEKRDMELIPVRIADGRSIDLSPGAHSELIRDIVESFAPRFTPGARVVYVGDTGDKTGYFDTALLAELGLTLDLHGKMPDVVLYFEKRDWLLLVESVTSHGPVDPKRHDELATLFAPARPGLVYVTAFPDRTVMARYLAQISWETEVWTSDAPTHLIHFDGERFLGPYEDDDANSAQP